MRHRTGPREEGVYAGTEQSRKRTQQKASVYTGKDRKAAYDQKAGCREIFGLAVYCGVRRYCSRS